ncbi:MAG: tRNA-binding protein [alpha proteobacterium HIMB59]|nr:MAG: tRNA-binding protein [alpha proteobacterium HIMB59]|tara:strand:+ start:222 stop:554 length:333 start_codon:yes stop_codon:yes gene_type:complete
MITFNDFEKIDIRVGTIVQTSVNDKANKISMLLVIDFGESIGLKKTSAQLMQNYNPDDLLGKQVAAVINFPPKQIGKMISEVLVLGFPNEERNPILIMPSQKVPNGGKLF